MAVQMLGIKTKFTDDQGRPLVGGKVHAYFAGTTTYQDTFKDPDMTIVNTNPILLDDSGSADVYLNGSYRIRVFDKNDVLIEEQDGVTQSASGEITTAKGEVIGLYGAVLNSLTNEVKRAVAAEKTIADSLTSETTRAKSAESALQSSIDAEAIRAKAAESDLNANIIKEVSDRESEVVRLDEADAVLQAQINSVGGGKLAYKTYAEMIADKSNISAKSSIDVIADTEDKNGTYLYDGTNFVRSQYDIEKLIRAKVQNTFGTHVQMVASNLSDGSYALVADDTADKNGVYIKEGGAWVKSLYDPLGNAKLYADSNALFKPKYLTASDDLNNVPTGYYYFSTPPANTPVTKNTPSAGSVFCINNSGIAYQKYWHYKTLEQFERVGNGASSSIFVWGAWSPVISRAETTAMISSVTDIANSKANINVFSYSNLTSTGAERYQATLTVEDGSNVLNLVGTTQSVFYLQDVDGYYLKEGDTITLSADAMSDGTAATGVDISMQFLDADNGNLGLTGVSANTLIDTYERLFLLFKIPAGSKKVRIKLIKRTGGTYGKFKNVTISNADSAANTINAVTSRSGGGTHFYVSKAGSDANTGTKEAPFLTIQRAVDSAVGGGTVIVLDDEPYRESIITDSAAQITIKAVRNKRVNLFGSDKLVVTKTAGFTNIYQAPLVTKPVGMGVGRAQPIIAEWGTPSKVIPDAERHFLQRGKAHRLPYTEMFEVATKAELDTTNGAWFWEAGVIYLSATDGGDATTKRYEARVRPTFTNSNGSVKLVNVTSWFSSFYGFEHTGVLTERVNCEVFGSRHNGFADFANNTISHNDRSGGCGNDGFNGTVQVADISLAESGTRLRATYFDPYGHDCGDDGISFHYRSDAIVYGGLFEHNVSSNVTHVTGAACACYNTVTHGSVYGFFANTAPSLDTERNVTTFRLVNTVASGAAINYRVGKDAHMECTNTLSINPSTMGYMRSDTGVMLLRNARNIGDPLKISSGNPTIQNGDLVV